MVPKQIQHKDLITIGKPTRCKGNIKRLRYGNSNSDYVICPECMMVFYMPTDDTFQARPMMKAKGRIPTKKKELPKLGRPFKKKRKPRQKKEAEQKTE